ncbi:Cyclic nucleotide-binding domain protein [Planctomycetes bacterium Pan216]|uniref:Cyclic nucleotide-binding domain protein n=1 Tax=Kolteria novifilia TaxID=2527975 RepID=A0A518B685_9BACT|nr:Cyclic nucleotide-binding domain protein [Planctomycetes bacterium Pan216]
MSEPEKIENEERGAALMRFLPGTPAFEGLTEEQVVEAADWFQFVELPPERDLLVQGSQACGCFVLIDGAVEIIVKTGAGEHEVRGLEAPSVIGEMGLLTAGVRSATVRSLTDITAAHLPLDIFERKQSENNLTALRIGVNLGRIVSQRLAWVQQRLLETQDEIKELHDIAGQEQRVNRVRQFFRSLGEHLF